MRCAGAARPILEEAGHQLDRETLVGRFNGQGLEYLAICKLDSSAVFAPWAADF